VADHDAEGLAREGGWNRLMRKPARRNVHTPLAARLLQMRDEERRALARELHDTTSQNLSALALTLAALERAAPELSAEARDALERSAALAKQCADELYRIGSAAHPPLLDPCGLAAAIRWHAEAFTRRTSIVVDLDLPSELGRFDPAVEIALFRVVEECLSNVERHAESERAHVRVVSDASAVRIDVVDEGRGFPATSDTLPPAGHGIPCMRERVSQLSGTLEIVSGRSGTVVRAMVPTRPAR
jgi:two-component system, NarL family, sensor kinase